MTEYIRVINTGPEEKSFHLILFYSCTLTWVTKNWDERNEFITPPGQTDTLTKQATRKKG